MENEALSVYAIMYMDGIRFKVLEGNQVKNKNVYVAIGINLEGMKDVLGMWIAENESSKYWLSVLNELKNRGVKDVLITTVDGLTGFEDAIKAVYPQAEVQRCIVHQLRNTFKYVLGCRLSHKSRKDIPTGNSALTKIGKNLPRISRPCTKLQQKTARGTISWL